MIIAVDFDGTIVEDQFPRIGPLLPNCIEVLKRLKEKGHTLILWTCRGGRDSRFKKDLLVEAVKFLKEQGIVFDYVNENVSKDFNPRKIYAHIYIDDRGLLKIDWLEIEKIIDEHERNRVNLRS